MHVLLHYDPSLPVILENSASQYSIGAIILHHFPHGDERSIACPCRLFKPVQKNKSHIKKDCLDLTIIFGATKYHIILSSVSGQCLCMIQHFSPNSL